MIERYSRPEMAEIFSEAGKYARWLEVELAVCEVHAERGLIPPASLAAIRAKAAVDPARVAEIEERVRHDVIAFTTALAEQIGPDSRYVHYGLTSSDVLDTALALQIRDAGRILAAGVERLRGVLVRRAREFQHAPCIGRTHGVHAEPTTFGLKLLVFAEEMRRQGVRLARALEDAAVGKISGAVGTFAHLPPAVEEAVCGRLGVGFEPAATQVVQRDRHAAFIGALALCACSCEKIAVELRHLARTEVREVQEEFGDGQKGSSAMPHKRNPWRLENVSGLARVLRGYASAALENQALWHERDISHSSVERVIVPDSFLALDHMLRRFAGIVRGMTVDSVRMRRNLDSTRGLVFSGQLLLELTARGMRREDAYRVVQRHAMECWKSDGDFRQRVSEDHEIRAVLPADQVAQVFKLERYLRHVDAVFARVFGT